MPNNKKGIIQKEADEGLRELIGQRIKDIRTRKHLSALTLAEKVKISRSALTQIETARNNISAVQLWKIAGVLHCKISDFFPEVPESSTLLESDLDKVRETNKKAAGYLSETYKIK